MERKAPPGTISATGIIAATIAGHMESAPTCKSDDIAAAHEHGPAGLVATISATTGAGNKQ